MENSFSYQPAADRYEQMPYKYCGKSGLQLPLISLGLWHNFGSVDNFNVATDMIKYAFDHGVTHFDLANNYGPMKRKYEEALMVEDVVGLVIGTRPDCMPISLLDYLEELGKHIFVLVEYGIESTDDETLRRINRGHTFAVSAEAVRKTAERGILVGGHIILGLPGEKREMLIGQAGVLSQLPLTTLKLHQLQLIKGTRMASEYVKDPEAFHFYTADEYVDLVIDYIEHLRPDIVLERFVSQSPKELLIAPDWGLKNYEFTNKVKKRMREKDAWQGKYYKY